VDQRCLANHKSIPLDHPAYHVEFEDVVAFDFDYEIDGQLYEGYFAHPAQIDGLLPGVMIAHQWMGLGEYEKFRSREWASFGYVAFALDVYGKGIRPDNSDDARGNTTFLRENPEIMRLRARESLKQLVEFNDTDPKKIAQFGYCFGGSVVLELARDSADIKATATFHGSLQQLIFDSSRNNILGAVVVHHADLDTGVTDEHVEGFYNEMRTGEHDWFFVRYGNAEHGFTEAGSPVYDEKADFRSLQITRDFFAEILQLDE